MIDLCRKPALKLLYLFFNHLGCVNNTQIYTDSLPKLSLETINLFEQSVLPSSTEYFFWA